MSDLGSQEDLQASGGTDDKGRRLPPLDSGIELTGRAVPQQTLTSAKDDRHGGAFDRTRRDEEIAWGSRTGFLADDWVEAETLLAGATGQGSPMREQGLAVLINRVNQPEVCVVADGYLYRRHPRFHDILDEKTRELVRPELKFDIVSPSDESSIGAARIAAAALR